MLGFTLWTELGNDAKQPHLNFSPQNDESIIGERQGIDLASQEKSRISGVPAVEEHC